MANSFRALVLIPDNVPDINNEVFDPAGIELDDGEVPVSFEFKRNDIKSLMGYAKYVRGEDGRIYADITLYPHVGPLPLLAKLTPAVGGSTISADDLYKRHDGHPRVLHKTRLNEVGLSLSGNCDKRILSLGQQGCFREVTEAQVKAAEVAAFKLAGPDAKPLPDIDVDEKLDPLPPGEVKSEGFDGQPEVLAEALQEKSFEPCRGECGNKDLDEKGICHRTHLLPEAK